MKDYLMAGGLLAAIMAFRYAMRGIVRPPADLEPFPTQAEVIATTCSKPGPRPGVEAFRAYVMQRFGGGDAGIWRECDRGANSEHKEGRAWDWSITTKSTAPAGLLAWLEKDNWANARRLGIGIIIWDRRIWSSWKREQGWRPYTGPDPHTTHMHLSFSKKGAMGATSGYKEGRVS